MIFSLLLLLGLASQTSQATPLSVSRTIERIHEWGLKKEFFKTNPQLRLDSSGHKRTVTEIADQYFKDHMNIDPFYAPYFGDGDFSQLGNDLSPKTRELYLLHYRKVYAELKKINPFELSDFESDTYFLLKKEIADGVRELKLPFHLIALNTWNGCRITDHIRMASDGFPFRKLSDYKAYLSRSHQIKRWVDTAIAVLNEGIQRGITLDTLHAKLFLGYLESKYIPEFEKSPLFVPISNFPKGITKKDQIQLREEFKFAYLTEILPEYSRLIKYYRETYIPHTTEHSGLQAYGAIGKKMYEHRIEYFADKKFDPKELHELGLKHVGNLANKLNRIKDQLGFKGTLSEFLRHMATEEDSYFKNRAEMLSAFENLRTEVNSKTPLFFDKVPTTDYVIKEVLGPDSVNAPSGAYNAPSESNPKGSFILNTGNLKSTPIYSVRPLSIHEAAPGHHFQLSIAFELRKELGVYRSISGSNAFIEGWAHYAEFLGNEMGLYPTTLDMLGFYGDQMLRAVRLVVDTGIHAYGWNQAKVVEYMESYLPNDLSDITSEANRYALYPGQALGYKVGQLEILKLRQQEKNRLGDQFDIKKFHDRVLSSGSLNLEVLDRKFN